MMDHELYMRRAIAVARQNPACPFGALLVDSRTGEAVAEGYNRTFANPTWHGEIDAINRFCGFAQPRDWTHLRMYTTAEPCCMCQAAILWAGIPAVFYGISMPRLQEMGWRQIDIAAAEVVRRTRFSKCELVGGILTEECDRLFASATSLREPKG